MPVKYGGNDLYMHLLFTEFGSKPFSVTLKRKVFNYKDGGGTFLIKPVLGSKRVIYGRITLAAGTLILEIK